MPFESSVSSVILSTYESVLSASGLANLAESVVRLAGGHSGAFVSYGSIPEKTTFCSEFAYNIDPSAQEIFLKRFDGVSPFRALERQAGAGQIITASALVSSEAYRKSAFYNEFFKKRDHFDYLSIMFTKSAAAMAGFAIMRPHSQGLVTELELDRLKLVTPHLQRAFSVRHLLSEQKSQLDMLETAIASTGYGLVIAAADRRITYANPVAEALLRARRGLKCEAGKIAAFNPRTALKLQSAVAAACRADGDTMPGDSLLVSDEEGGASLVLHIVPVSPRSSNIFVEREQFCAAIFIVNRRSPTSHRVKNFASLFRVTPGEARMLGELISGEKIASICSRLAISENTARTHLKNILSKTETHSQAQLMKLFFETTLVAESY